IASSPQNPESISITMCPNQAGSSSSGGKHDGKKSGDPTGSPDNLCLFAEQPLGLSLSRTRVFN
ncbi:hypothetical protein, partial [uncultured Muribaculum sp.]|uniref:hypothetical protein n=1 Tax=uncultured Muribaculum sp. TaxID=1918613 RepID=UPI0025B71A05